jgi:flagellar biogenesis protein FliO
MKRWLHMAVATGTFIWLPSLWAAAPEVNSFASPALPDTGVSLLRVTGALALVVGLFLGGVWLYKNWQRVLYRSKGAPKLNIIEVRPLGGRHALYLVGYHQQRLLLAASPAGVQFITHLPDAEADSPATSSFARTLDQAVSTVPVKLSEGSA